MRSYIHVGTHLQRLFQEPANDGASKRQPGGILGKRNKLKKLGANILTDGEAARLVEELIRKRDDTARNLSEQMSEPFPDWVGKD